MKLNNHVEKIACQTYHFTELHVVVVRQKLIGIGVPLAN